jgi:hypothetical protein
MYRTVVTICTASLTLKILNFTHTVYTYVHVIITEHDNYFPNFLMEFIGTNWSLYKQYGTKVLGMIFFKIEDT